LTSPGLIGPRSCTWTEFPARTLNGSSFAAQSLLAESECDLTLLTCLLVGSFRFCIVPLLAAFNGTGGKLHSSLILSN
uniref:Uncharacterized protein n=1 Tax=Oryzias latipes TaxID=8090 RepID=A0A3P9MIZ6_ORYLA